MRRRAASRPCLALFVLLALAAVSGPLALPAGAGEEPLTFAELMKLRTVRTPVLSRIGDWLAYELRPDRGDGELVVRAVEGTTLYTVPRGSEPVISSDSRWVAALVQPTLAEQEKAKTAKGKGKGGDGDDGPKTGLAILATRDGALVTRDRVESFAFSEDGRWLAYQLFAEEEDEGAAEGEGVAEGEEGAATPEPALPPTGVTPSAGGLEPPPEGVPQPAVPEPPGAAAPGEQPEPEPSGAVPAPSGEPPAEAGTEPAAEPASGPPGGPVPEPPGEEMPAAEEPEPKDERKRATLVLRELASGEELEIPTVGAWSFDARSEYLAYAVAAHLPSGEEVEEGEDESPSSRVESGEGAGAEGAVPAADLGDGIYLRALTREGQPATALRRDARGRYTGLVWTGERSAGSALAFVAALDAENGEPGDGTLHIWDGELRVAASSEDAPEGWFVPAANELAWSADGERLFFGFKPRDERVEPEEEAGPLAEAAFDPYDLEALLAEREVDVWSWDDPTIVPHQKKVWKEENDRVYRAVYHRRPAAGEARVVALADRTLRRVDPVDNAAAALGLADAPYLREITWEGWFADVYRVSLSDGSRQRVAERLPLGFGDEGSAALSPDGRWVVWFDTPHWQLFDGASGESRNLTATLSVPFADEDHDYPSPAPGYGVAGWVEPGAGRSGAVLLYDKFDLWSFPLGGGAPVRLTEGRETRTIYRVADLRRREGMGETVDPWAAGEPLLLTAYDDRDKHQGLATLAAGEPGVRTLVGEPGAFFEPVARPAPPLWVAASRDRLLFTRESYVEFPDLWAADLAIAPPPDGEAAAPRPALGMGPPHRLSDANPGLDRFAWGTAELVRWETADGIPLDGVLILPDGRRLGDGGERLPVLVYFYRFFSQRLHRFNEPAVNHRPSFPVYASHGYAIFLPDIRFEIGRPGHAATKALVSGVETLIAMGVADPDAVGIHGHSWSGYQTAFAVTQTDLFAAAVAGAPVSNMTSAYGGIRWGTGLARMFQYEQSQSRLGVSLWEDREPYIASSPLFYADRIETPLLIQFGDEDGAVPWTQGIELYLALRRLGKPAWMLQYRGEDHHLASYANKLDYSIKMKEFFDHYLQGAPAPEWLTAGVPYRGE